MRRLNLEANNLIKRNLSGLSGFSRLVIYEALEYCDYKNGIVLLPTLHEFAQDFYVERAPGRKREEINEATIRNAFRTIKKFKGDFFKFRTINQRVEIEMPEVRELYQSLVDSKQDAGVKVGNEKPTKTLATTEQKDVVVADVLYEKVTEDAAASSPNNNIFINKNIKLTNSNAEPAIIADDFYPSEKFIQKAKASGFTRAEDKAEIQAFIDYNKANKTTWADFNPIYLRWLKRGFEHQLRHQARQDLQQQKQTTRSNRHVSNTHKSSNRVQPRVETARERVIRNRAEKKQQANVVVEGGCRASMGRIC